MTQREETFQVALDILKNTTFYNAFLISADIDVDIFRNILDISPKVANQDFTKPPSFDDLREFLRELGYNDRLRLSRIEILWGMYHEANVDYAATMWDNNR
ncbi:hypothetical protein Tco_0022448 [Tanacetum coccineum]